MLRELQGITNFVIGTMLAVVIVIIILGVWQVIQLFREEDE